ncbi:MAG TPA: aquaporin, partial [Marmoricola sp.]|nr:aquaporin [Marmoricola sp.]
MTPLMRRVVAEGVGTAILVATVVGSGIAATQLSPGNVGLQLLENSIATGAVLVALILSLQPVSAAFNPVVSLIERMQGLISTREAVASIGSQIAGGVVGTVLANLMFNLSAFSISAHHRASHGTLLGEVVATA